MSLGHNRWMVTHRNAIEMGGELARSQKTTENSATSKEHSTLSHSSFILEAE